MESSPEEIQARKRYIYDSMSARRRKRIDRIGYENWDPFEEPKDPIDIRKDRTKRTTQVLVREFLQTRAPDASVGNAYSQGVLDLALGIVNQEDRALGMFEFSCWYRDLLKREGFEE